MKKKVVIGYVCPSTNQLIYFKVLILFINGEKIHDGKKLDLGFEKGIEINFIISDGKDEFLHKEIIS